MKNICLAIICLALFLIWQPMAEASDGEQTGVQSVMKSNSPDLLDDDSDWEEEGVSIYDPLEPFNRVMFTFNDKLYFWVLKPVTTGYSQVLPEDIRMVIGNFFKNLAAPVRFVNTLLQGRFDDSATVLGRFVLNSTVGVFGLGDVAELEFGLEPQIADFGQTLGRYGIQGGVYICWPFFGASNVRDSIGLAADMQLHPYAYPVFEANSEFGVRALEHVNLLSFKGVVYEDLKEIALDPYIASREAYVDYRRKIIESP